MLEGKQAPEFTWTIDINGTGNITVDVGNTNPHSVTMWHATTCNGKRRDFRIVNLDNPCTCGVRAKGVCANLKVFWFPKKLTEEPGRPGIYVASRPAPKEGWTAFFVDVQYGERPNSILRKKMPEKVRKLA